MTVFAAIATQANKSNAFVILGLSTAKSAASRRANKAVTDPYGKRSANFGEVNICEFEDASDAREYVARINRN